MFLVVVACFQGVGAEVLDSRTEKIGNNVILGSERFVQNNQGQWINFTNYAILEYIGNGEFKVAWEEYSFTYEYGIIYNGVYHSMADIIAQYPSAKKNFKIDKSAGSWKYSFNITNIPVVVQNNLEKFIIKGKSTTGFELSDIIIINNSFFIEGIEFSFDDITKDFPIFVNTSARRIEVLDVGGKANLWIDPTIRLNKSNNGLQTFEDTDVRQDSPEVDASITDILWLGDSSTPNVGVTRMFSYANLSYVIPVGSQIIDAQWIVVGRSNWKGAISPNFRYSNEYYSMSALNWNNQGEINLTANGTRAINDFAGVSYSMNVTSASIIAEESTGNFIMSLELDSESNGRNYWSLQSAYNPQLVLKYLEDPFYWMNVSITNSSYQENIVCNISYSGNGTIHNATYEWLKDSVNQNISTQNISFGLTLVGENWTCRINSHINLTDGDLRPVEVKNYSILIDDNVNPIIYADSLSSASGQTGTPITISVNVSDVSADDIYVNITDGNGGTDNFLMSLSSGITYVKSWIPSVPSNHSFVFSVIDDYENIADIESNLTFLASGEQIFVAQGGGGGGGTPKSDCALRILAPSEQIINNLCPINGTANPVNVFVQNNGSVQVVFGIRYEGVECDVVPEKSLIGLQRDTFQVSGCPCPPIGEKSSSLVVLYQQDNSGCEQSIDLKLSTTTFGTFVSGLRENAMWIILGFFFVAFLIYLYIITSS